MHEELRAKLTVSDCTCTNCRAVDQIALKNSREHFAAPSLVYLRNDCRNFVLMTCHYSNLGWASDWLVVARPIRSTTKIWIVTRHQHGISAVVPQTSFPGETKCGVVKSVSAVF